MVLLTTIDYYDQTRDHTEMQLFNLFKSDNFQLQITIRSCQQQTNGADRKICAVASTFYISSGIGVSCIKIDDTKMRAFFEPFPDKHTNTVTLFFPENISTVEVFCICRMWWVWYHNKNSDLSMAECDAVHK